MKLQRALSLLLLSGALSGSALAADVGATASAPLPGDDFFLYVNGDWLAKNPIPADRSSWSAGAALDEATNLRVKKLIEAAAADKSATGEHRKIGDFYTAFMDEAGIEARGTAPLQPLLKKIDALGDRTALARALGESLRADVDALNSTTFFTENLFGLWITQGLNDPDHYLPYLLQGGLGMPDRAYYLTDSPRMAGLRTAYQAHIAAMLKLAGFTDSDARAARVMALEMKIAQAHASREDSADVLKANNTWTLKDFSAKAPGLDWNAFFKAAGLAGQQRFMIWHPGAVSGEAALVASVDLASWKDYLAFHTVNHFAGVLPKAFAEQNFAFYGTALSGTPEQRARWKRALDATNTALDEPVGHLYVDASFPAENKARIGAMVSKIVAAFSQRVEKLDWMAPSTRAQAQAKLKVLYVGIGYPDRWRSYAGLKVVPGDAFGNQMRGELFHRDQQLAKLHQRVDQHEWSLAAQTLNAVNMPMQNALNFPAAILQPPFYDPAKSDAWNYGAIGSVIGHEISHSFDDQGSQFDSHGRLRDWWTPADSQHFKTSTAALAAQYSAYKPFPDLAVNGQQTLSENLADLAGLGAAYDAYVASLGGKAPTAEQEREFFIGFAANWGGNSREAAERRQILTDGHSPSKYRALTVRNIDAWYKAFDVKPGQALYLAPAERVRAW